MIEGLPVHALALCCSQRLVQFIQFLGGDVLLLIHSQNFVLLLVANQFFLGSFHLHLQVNQLFLQPVGGGHRGLKTRSAVVLDVGLHQRVDDIGGCVGLGAEVM